MDAEPDAGQAQTGGSGKRRQGREQDYLRQGGGTEPGAGSGQQLGVAPAQSLATAPCSVQRRDCRQTQVTERRAQCAVRQLIGIEQEGGGKTGDGQRQGQGVGEKTAAKGDPPESQNPPAEKTIEPGALPVIDQHRGK